ncbi:UDP-N-acetylmuramate--L-alanine ligase [Helicobacter monodelphidis]|uniref:UDP-N-acetylmuramate--L-alanine ligase n=1 Tax=Helicobacter sp. 15-1451 TaxID=2004995 RepID=UPI000DCE883C|nr:UDP-N-acetylmuramate--L-alanine ligase [Helicobacter sp. 15-1451]RAX59199.1 UDP-N-acetylmuramate--L-alanine ligase [Helicobacter sp. 15-1451]
MGKIQKIHFIGIGGIGISGLARYLNAQGVAISGSDIKESKTTKELQQMGIKITIPHDASAINDQDIVVHSAIIKQDNIEILVAKQKGIAVLSRKEVLPLILGDKKVYSVAGAHGKSTTSAILSALLPESSAIIGAISKEFGSNVRQIKSESVVFEADESDQSFLSSNPYCAIVVNAEAEHLENYNYDLHLFHGAYAQFLLNSSKRIINAEDSYLETLSELRAMRLFPSKDIRNIHYHLINGEPYTQFELKSFGLFRVWGIGEHIALDASLAILSLVDEVGIEVLRQRLLNFKGIEKRFDVILKGKLTIIDDYAHHPTEVKATLVAVHRYAQLLNVNIVTIIWQPHKYSRLLSNLEGFKECFGKNIRLIILPVYAASEEYVKIDFMEHFGHYQPILATHIKRINQGNNQRLLVMNHHEVLLEITEGLSVGFGAGDITTMLRYDTSTT